MYISEQALDLIGISYEDYLLWCETYGFAPYKKKTRKEFFKKIKDCTILKDKKTGRLITKYSRKKIDGENDDEKA